MKIERVYKYENGYDKLAGFEIHCKTETMDAHEFFEDFTRSELEQIKKMIDCELEWRTYERFS